MTNYMKHMPQIVSIGMLLWAFNPDNPYGYYILLRIVVCASCVYLAFRASEINKEQWAWILGISAFVYNPIIRIHLNREIWSIVNIATIIMLIMTFWTLRNPFKQKKEEKKEFKTHKSPSQSKQAIDELIESEDTNALIDDELGKRFDKLIQDEGMDSLTDDEILERLLGEDKNEKK